MKAHSIPNLNQERQQAHALLDMLPAEKLNAVRSLLEVMVQEEDLTPETAAALDRAVLHWHAARAYRTKRSSASSA